MTNTCIRPFTPFSLNLRGNLKLFDRPAVMGIVNVTPDSFYSGSRASTPESVSSLVKKHVAEGADILDLGAYSSRPGADDVSPQEEIGRLAMGMKVIRDVAPDITVSIDTFRATVARTAIEELGADIINDIGGGDLDPEMFDTVAELGIPYILMHMRGTPSTMQSLTDYSAEGGVTAAVTADLSRKIDRLYQLGVADVIADPGLGFAKTVSQNYELLRNTGFMADMLGVPLLIGLSRKSMLTRPLEITPADALPATVAANTMALLGGASVIRVHDTAAAVAAREIVSMTLNS